MIEQTLVLIKHDGVARHLIGEIIKRFEQRGLKIVALKMVQANDEICKNHYGSDIIEKHGERVYNLLVNYIKEGPIIAIVIEGVSAINIVRKIVGSTYPNDAPVGTIRGDFAHTSREYANTNKVDMKNLIHASANKEDAEREISCWFTKEEIHSYSTVSDKHLF